MDNKKFVIKPIGCIVEVIWELSFFENDNLLESKIFQSLDDIVKFIYKETIPNADTIEVLDKE